MKIPTLLAGRSVSVRTVRGSNSDFQRPGRLLAVLVPMVLLGCRPAKVEMLPSVSLDKRVTVLAHGQILPAGGIVRLAASPTDVVARRLVDVGDRVSQGQTLVELQSQQVIASQLRTLHLQRQEAELDRDNAIAAAQRQLAAAELKIDQLRAQRESLEEKSELLDFAQEQVTATEQMLKKMEAISVNAATSEFVGQLEIDRLRISLRDAELKYREQQAAQRQAQQDFEWGLKAAETERAGAKDLLAATQASQALQILDAEIQSLVEQAAASRIVAPIDGVILALNAAVGESSAPLPLVQLANLDEMVCEVEINELDAAVVQPGQAATITARGLGERQLKGRVGRKFNLVGQPQLRSPNPLARVDYQMVTASVILDDASSAIAKDWLQLQVEVSIDISSGQVQ